MDKDAFDRFARVFGAARTRRNALGALLSASLIGVAGGVDAKTSHKNRSRQRKRKSRAKDKSAAPVVTEAADCSSLGPGSNVNGCNFNGEPHVEEDISGSSMVATKFNNADLCGADLSGSQLKNAQFKGANLTRADLSSSGCKNTQFNGATVFCRTKDCNGALRNDDCPGVDPAEICCTDAQCANPTPACGANNRCGACTANAQCGVNGVCTCGSNAAAGQCQEDYAQGFEQTINGWDAPIAQVASGAHGITSRNGSSHAEAGAGAFTRWGGYSNVFPSGGYDTELAIYLDPANGPADAQFDYSSAVNQPDCGHRRDFIFAAGKSSGDPRFCVSASNNSPGWPCNPGRDPEVLTDAGWYLFKHEFRDNGSGVLTVDMKLFAPNGNLLNTWTLSDPSDAIGSTIGGNRYGWIVTSDFPFLAIDDAKRA